MTQFKKSMEKEKAVDALRQFASRFNLKVRTQIAFDECPSSIALGIVPYFGSPNGVLIDSIEPPNYEGDNALKKYAYDNEIYYSQVNAAQMASYTDSDFLEMFRDWGYYGESQLPWLDGRE